LKGNGFNLTKIGSGMVSIACQRTTSPLPFWDLNLGNVVINGGILAFAESLTLGNPAKTVTVNSGATFQLFNLALTNPILRNVFMTGGKINSGGGDTDTNVLNGTINLTGGNTFQLDQGAMIVNGPITGSGSVLVTATAPGRLYLNGANTFTGGLTVSNGVVGGTGSVADLTMQSNATLAPGQIDVIGTLSVAGNATLAGSNLFEINRSLSPNSDRLNAGGTLSFGGVLNVVLGVGAPAPQAGDVYQLFNKGSATSFSSVLLPSLSGLPGNLSWNTANLNSSGSISVNGTVVSNPPTFTSVTVSGTNIVMSGTGGTQGNNYILLKSTSLPTWTPIATNQFGAGGSFSITNGIGSSASFFELQVP
jgi:autotransporter-associated beta strand protein